MKKLFVILSLVALSCSRQEHASIASDAVAPASTQVARVAEKSAGSPPVSQATAPSVLARRMIVRTANMRIIVADTAKTVDAVTRAVEAMGGFVSDASVWREGEVLRARLTLRVPADKLNPALASIRGVAKRVETESIASDDVSAEFVDLDARVRNLEATEEELRQLLVVARQNSRKATEVLEVHQHLSAIRGEIEQAKGRMRHLSEVTAMSSIALEITPDALAQPVVEPGWQPLAVARDAMRALVAAGQSLATVAIWLVIYVVPIFGALALVVAGVWRLAKRWRTAG